MAKRHRVLSQKEMLWVMIIYKIGLRFTWLIPTVPDSLWHRNIADHHSCHRQPWIFLSLKCLCFCFPFSIISLSSRSFLPGTCFGIWQWLPLLLLALMCMGKNACVGHKTYTIASSKLLINSAAPIVSKAQLTLTLSPSYCQLHA